MYSPIFALDRTDRTMQIPERQPQTISTLQDVFLNGARRKRLLITIRLMDGTDVEGRLKSFDRFVLLVEHNGTDIMLFKYSIASIRPHGSAEK